MDTLQLRRSLGVRFSELGKTHLHNISEQWQGLG